MCNHEEPRTITARDARALAAHIAKNQLLVDQHRLARDLLLLGVPSPAGAFAMSIDHVNKLIKDHAIEWVDLRFADMLVSAHQVRCRSPIRR